MKSVQIHSFFWSSFSCIRSELGKTLTRKNFIFGQFSHSETQRRIQNPINHIAKESKNFVFLDQGNRKKTPNIPWKYITANRIKLREYSIDELWANDSVKDTA